MNRPALRIRSANKSRIRTNATSVTDGMIHPSKPDKYIKPVKPRKVAADIRSPAIASPFCGPEMLRPAAKNSVAERVRRDAHTVTARVTATSSANAMRRVAFTA